MKANVAKIRAGILLPALIFGIGTSQAQTLNSIVMGTASVSDGHNGTFTLASGEVIPYTISAEWTGDNAATTGATREIVTIPTDSTGTRTFAKTGNDLWFVTGGTGSSGYTITFDLRGENSSNLVFAVGHLFQHNEFQLFAVPAGGSLVIGNTTTGRVGIGASTHDPLTDWSTYRAPTYSENNTIYSAFAVVPSITTNSTYGAVFDVQSTSGSGSNSTYQFMQSGKTSNLDYVVARFDLNPNNTGNSERWNLAVGQAVPEPSSAILGGLSLVGLVAFRRRPARA